MHIYHFIPVVLIVLGVVYSIYMRRRVANMTPEQAAQAFHDHYAEYFSLSGEEKIVGIWSGVEFQGPKGAGARLAGAALNSASAAITGVSEYVPSVQIALTSSDQVLISREYSEAGSRGNFEQIAAFGPGTRAVDAETAYPGAKLGSKLSNPLNPVVALEFVQLQAPSGDSYDAWLSPQGALTSRKSFCSILSELA